MSVAAPLLGDRAMRMDRARWAVVLAVSFASFMAALSSTLIDVVIPEMMGELGIPLERAHWLATGFLLSNTVFLLAAASSIQRFGLKKTYLLGVAIFAGGAVLGSVTSREILLVTSRVIQGVGAGLLQPVAVVAIAQVFPAERRGFAMGIFGAGVLMGPTLGPLFGAVLVDAFGWRSTYMAQVPLAVICFCLGSALLRPDPGFGRAVRFDSTGFVLLCIWVSGLLLTLTTASERDASDPVLPLLCALSLTGLLLFLAHQLNGSARLVELMLLARPRFALANVIVFTVGFALYGSLLLIPLYLQSVLMLSATTSGLVLLPAGLIMVALSPLGGYLSDVLSPRLVVTFGMVVFAVSIAMMASIGPMTSFWELITAVCVGRAGLACLLPSLYSAALRSVPAEAISQAAGITNFSRQLGGTLGVAVVAVLLEGRITVNWQVFVNELDSSVLRSAYVGSYVAVEQLALSSGSIWARTYAYREVLWATSAGVLMVATAGLLMGRASTARSAPENTQP